MALENQNDQSTSVLYSPILENPFMLTLIGYKKRSLPNGIATFGFETLNLKF